MKHATLIFTTAIATALALPAYAQQTTQPAPDAQQKQGAQQSQMAQQGSHNAQDGDLEIFALPAWHPDLTSDATTSVERLLDFDAYGSNGEDIGGVENVLFDTDGQILSIIAEVGGFLDIGDTHVNVPWSEVQVDPAAERVTIPVTV
jgi:sporulation protein YlmC with PRC-barrel domain